MGRVIFPCDSCEYSARDRGCGVEWWFLEIYNEFRHRELPNEMEIVLECKKKIEERYYR